MRFLNWLNTTFRIPMLLGSLAFLTGLTALGTLAAYYALYVIGDAQYIAWNAVAQAVGTFAVAAFIPAIVRRLGKKRGYIVLGLVGVIAGVVLAFAPPSVPLIAVFGFFLAGIGLGGVNTLMWALEADTVEYGEWKTNIRTEGTTYALFSFTRKMGQAIGTTSARGEYPKDRKVTASQVLSTLYRAVGIDPSQTFPNGSGRPMYILDDREPVRELL